MFWAFFLCSCLLWSSSHRSSGWCYVWVCDLDQYPAPSPQTWKEEKDVVEDGGGVTPSSDTAPQSWLDGLQSNVVGEQLERQGRTMSVPNLKTAWESKRDLWYLSPNRCWWCGQTQTVTLLIKSAFPLCWLKSTEILLLVCRWPVSGLVPSKVFNGSVQNDIHSLFLHPGDEFPQMISTLAIFNKFQGKTQHSSIIGITWNRRCLLGR